MPNPFPAHLRIPGFKTQQFDQNESAMRDVEIMRWANEQVAIFPVYTHPGFMLPDDVFTFVDEGPVESPVGSTVEIVVQKRFNWTHIMCELSMSALSNEAGRYVEFFAVPDSDWSRRDRVSRFWFSESGIHQTIHGYGDGIPLNSGQHRIALYTAGDSSDVIINQHDHVTFRVQEAAPVLFSGKAWESI